MRVLFITKSLEPTSGWGRMSSALIKGVKEKDLEVGVVSEDDRLLPLSIGGLLVNIFRIRKKARDYDIIHALEGWPFGVYGYLAVWGTRKKLFINGIGTYSVVPFNNFIKGWILGKTYKRAEKVFCISRYTEKRILEKISLKNTEVIYLGVDKLRDDRTGENGEIEQRDNFPILLTVGAVKDRKGQFYVLKAVNFLKKIYPKIKYYVVGSWDDNQYVERMREYTRENGLESNLELVGKVEKDEDLVYFYKNCDVFLLCSISTEDYFEGFGLVLIEAASFGKPVIAGVGSGTEEAIKDGCNGYLVKQKDSKDIYNKVINIIEGKRESLSFCSKAWAAEFSWERTVASYVKFYKE